VYVRQQVSAAEEQLWH